MNVSFLRPAARLLLFLLTLPLACAAAAPTFESLQQEIQDLKKDRVAQQQEIEALKARVGEMRADRGERPPETRHKSSELADFSMNYRSNGLIKAGGLKLGSYGEMKFGEQQTPSGWQNGFDAARVVLLPSYQITENILFNAEIEFEHGGFAGGADDKVNGSAQVEQAYIDFLFNDHFNWRAPGVDVVPLGYINLFHEPTQFYSVNRPELYNGLIPSTWFEGATSFYGKIVDGLKYQFQVSSGLEDTATTGSTLPSFPGAPGGYGGGITAVGDHAGLGNARAPVGDFNQGANNLGYALRLSSTPSFAPGLSGSASAYYTPNTTPRGAYGDNGVTPFPLGPSSLTMFDTELRYRIPRTGFDLRGEYVRVFFGSPQNLRVNNDTDPANNVGATMYGFSLEAAYHWDLNGCLPRGWEVVPFYRYTRENLQAGGFAGNDANAPTGAGQLQFHTVGLALFPTPQLVLKIDYQRVLDETSNSPKTDHVLGSVGWFF